MTVDNDELQRKLRVLNTRAIQAKMDLHDLAEELPCDWEKIMAVAQAAYDAHRALMDARAEAAAAQH